MSVGISADTIFTQPPLVIQTGQTDFPNFSRRHDVLVRLESAELASGGVPVVEYVHILLVTHVF